MRLLSGRGPLRGGRREKLDDRSQRGLRQGDEQAEQEQTKSAISDHVARANHVVNWDDSKILGKEHVRKSREVREAMEIRKRGTKTMNREEGTYFLSHIFDPLLNLQNW